MQRRNPAAGERDATVAVGRRDAGRATARPPDIVERTFRFSMRVLKVVRSLPQDACGAAIARQLVRSGTAIGANVEEAQGLHTRKDFARRMNTARTEARETAYWLRLIGEDGMLPRQRLHELIAEANEIVRILTAIIKRTRASSSD